MHSSLLPASRRQFLRLSSLAGLGLLLPRPPSLLADSKAVQLFPEMGTTGSLAKAEEIKAAGAAFLVEGVASLLMPDSPESDFEKKLEETKLCPLPVRACNSFLREKSLICVGPKAAHARVLSFADIAFRRAKKAGLQFIVFGSGGARQVPEGWPVEKADEQFIDLLQKMGPLAEAQGLTVAVEPLQVRECNYLTRLSEVAKVVRAAGQPAIRGLADFYHMANMNEGPEALEAAMDIVYWVEIAEKVERTAPGVKGDDFTAYFRVLAAHNYTGGVTIEGKWNPEQLAYAFKEIRRQAEAVQVRTL